MSTAPAPYARQANFTSFEQSSPTLPKPGSSLDAEFNAVLATLNAALARLSEIQRNDGLLANASVHPDALTAEVLTLIGSNITPRGNWQTGVVYQVRDLVEQGAVSYIALSEHLSADFAGDVADGKWQTLTAAPTAATVAFSPSGGLVATNVQAAITEVNGVAIAKQAANDNLSALAGLTFAADRLPYATGVGAMALATLTAYARTLLAVADAAAARSTLGVVFGTAAGNAVQLDGSARLPAVNGSLLTGVIPANGSVGEAQLADTLNLSSKTVTLPASLTPVFTKSFVSAEQTISNAGTAALAHSLGEAPKLVQVRLVCKTAELGYSINDEIVWGTVFQAFDRGVSISVDATNVTYRYANQSTVFSYANKSTGAVGALTNGNWRMVVRAWA